jgi:sulfide dehydrogenase cytochrome subunit
MTISRIGGRSVAALLLAACGAVQAQTASAQPAQAADGTTTLRTRSLAAQCAQCHGTDGRALPGAEVPGLAGQPASYLAEQMKAFRSGSRTSSVMQQLAKGFNDAQVDQLARYFASQPAGSKP